jgi:cystathionine gamma-synthase
MSDLHNKQTKTVRAGIGSDESHGAVVPPLHLSSTFTFAGFEQKRAHDYSRTSNPTRATLGDALAELEQGSGGIVTASGMAACTLALQLLEPGQRLIAPHDCYGGTYRLVTALAKRGAFELELLDLSDEKTLQAALESAPRMLWIETPSNPLLRITNMALVEKAKLDTPKMLVVSDNTFLSPVLQQPLTQGADIVVHSTTKYINGHSDVVGGAVVCKDPALHEELGWWANCLGLTGAPFDSFLTLRGLRTLHSRMAVHERNTQLLAERLESHPAIAKVYFPGLKSHPQHALAAAQQQGFGGMLSFELSNKGTAAVRAFLQTLELFSLAVSLGGVESLISHPATMTHAAMDAEARAEAGIADELLRISVGIEDADDLWRDLEAAIAAAESAESCAA